MDMSSEKKEALIRAAFEFQNGPAPHIIYDVNYWLFGESRDSIPLDYCGEDPAAMVDYQVGKMKRHAADYDDVYIPFLMPWYGTGVLGSGFGVPIVFPDYMDPAVDLSQISDVGQIKDLQMPRPDKDGLLPRVMNAIRYMRETTDLPVGVTDCQGPLTTALQVIGYENMIYWMHDHPDMIHELMQIVTDALIEWVKVQKEAAGQRLDNDAYVLGVKIPADFGGVWISDDDSVIFGTDLYREFVVPYNSQVLKAFAGGAIHYCGNANQHIDSYLQTEGLSAIHNLNLDDIGGAARMRKALAEKGIIYIAADFNVAPGYVDEYYSNLFGQMGTEGLIVVSYIAPAIMLDHGKYAEANLDPRKIGREIEAAIRKYNHA